MLRQFHPPIFNHPKYEKQKLWSSLFDFLYLVTSVLRTFIYPPRHPPVLLHIQFYYSPTKKMLRKRRLLCQLETLGMIFRRLLPLPLTHRVVSLENNVSDTKYFRPQVREETPTLLGP